MKLLGKRRKLVKGKKRLLFYSSNLISFFFFHSDSHFVHKEGEKYCRAAFYKQNHMNSKTFKPHFYNQTFFLLSEKCSINMFLGNLLYF